MKLIDKAERTDGTFPRSDFAFDPDRNFYVCPGGKEPKKIPPSFRHATRRADEGRHDDLLRQQARLRGLCAQA